jgi:hypothetical protein
MTEAAAAVIPISRAREDEAADDGEVLAAAPEADAEPDERAMPELAALPLALLVELALADALALPEAEAPVPP